MPDAQAIQEQFVILAAPRSGSNMLCTMLASHGSILCHHEIFNPKGVRLALRLRGTDFSLGTIEERERDPLEFLERVWRHRLGFASVGFKLTHRQNEAVFRHLLSDRSVAKIVLRRRNRLKTFVSHQISTVLAEWEVYRTADLAKDRPRVTVEPREFLERVAFDDAYYQEIRVALDGGGQRWIEVAYETLFDGERQAEFVRFLGLPPASGGLKIGSVKQNSCDLRDLIANYDELARHFAGTPFESELKDCGH